MIDLDRRALIVVPWFYGFERSVPRAFERCGLTVDTHVYFPHDTLADKIRNRVVGEVAPRVGLAAVKRRRDEAFGRRVLEAARASRPDIVVVIKGEVLDPATVEAVSRGSRLLYWAIDDPSRFPNVTASLGLYGHAVSFSRSAVAYLAGRVPSARFLANGYDETIFRRLDVRRPALGVDVSFVGARYARREEALRAALDAGAGLGIWGGDWKRMPWRARYYRKRGELDRYVRGAADLSRSNEIYNNARVNLNVHGDWDGLNTRVFEIPGAGGFQLCDEREDLGEFLTPDKEVAVYRDLDELREKTAFYLRNERARAAMGAAGEERARSHHTWTHRVGELLAFAGMR